MVTAGFPPGPFAVQLGNEAYPPSISLNFSVYCLHLTPRGKNQSRFSGLFAAGVVALQISPRRLSRAGAVPSKGVGLHLWRAGSPYQTEGSLRGSPPGSSDDIQALFD